MYSILFIPTWAITMDDIHDSDKVGGFLEHASEEWFDWHDLNKEDVKYALMWIDGRYKEIHVNKDRFYGSYCQTIELTSDELREIA